MYLYPDWSECGLTWRRIDPGVEVNKNAKNLDDDVFPGHHWLIVDLPIESYEGGPAACGK